MERVKISPEFEHNFKQRDEGRAVFLGLVSDEPRPVREPSGLELLHETIQTEIETLHNKSDVFIPPIGAEIPELLQ